MSRDREFDCAICGAEMGTLRVALVRWLDGRYDKALRCTDTDGCRKRVIAQGDVWPIIDPKVATPTNGKHDPNGPRTDWKAETRRVRASQPPGMSDPTPPRVDPETGQVTWAKPRLLPPISEPPEEW